jgi:hypothetical protein
LSCSAAESALAADLIAATMPDTAIGIRWLVSDASTRCRISLDQPANLFDPRALVQSSEKVLYGTRSSI